MSYLKEYCIGGLSYSPTGFFNKNYNKKSINVNYSEKENREEKYSSQML